MPDRSTRREFLQNSTLAMAAGLISVPNFARATENVALSNADPAADAAAASIPIVDTHQHLWDLSKFHLPWTKGNAALGKSFVMADYLAATAGLNIAKTVYMEVDVHPSQQVREAEYVIDLCQKPDNPMVAAVISGRPGTAEFADYITKFKGSPYIKGVRQVLHVEETPPDFCVQPQFVKNVQLLGELGMCFDLCMRSEDLPQGEKLVAQCPNTRFVVDHCGNMDPKETDEAKRNVWKDAMKALAARPNVVCKISGIVASAKKDWTPADLAPVVLPSIEIFGIDRVMFAGDWPVCTLAATFKQWVEALHIIVKDFPIENKKKLFHDNAVKFYGLVDKPKA